MSPRSWGAMALRNEESRPGEKVATYLSNILPRRPTCACDLASLAMAQHRACGTHLQERAVVEEDAFRVRVPREMPVDSTSTSLTQMFRPTLLHYIHPIMAVTIPTTHNPPWVLLSLALLQDIPIKWDAESGEKGHATYNGVTGTEAVRAELEKNIPGKEVGAFLALHISPGP